MLEHVRDEFMRIGSEIWDDHTALAFTTVIVLWFGAALYLAGFHRSPSHEQSARFVAITPRTLVMLGVFGTFFGILIGLLDFDVNKDINDSVSELLDGLKVAFTTSVVGIFFALVFQATTLLFPPLVMKGDDIPAAIREVLKEQKELLKTLVEEQTLTRRGQEKLIEEFREFERKIAEKLVEELVTAIKDVADVLNKMLQDVVGESFKKLTEAVERLVEWQENYKEYIEKTQKQLDEIVASLEASKTALEIIRAHTEAIPDSIKQLEDILKAVNTSLEAFADLREKAGEALPHIKEDLNKITSGLTDAGKEIETNAQKLSQQMHDSIKEMDEGIKQQLKDISKNSEEFLKEFGENLVSLSEKFSKDYMPLTERLQEVLRIAETIESKRTDKIG